MATIAERAVEFVPHEGRIGLGSGRAAQSFVKVLGARIRDGRLRIQGVATSAETEQLACQEKIPLIPLADAGILDLTVDGADEVDPQLDVIKGYGRALLREKIVAASSRRLVILVGEEKLVPKLGTRGKLPVEITPFALPLCERRLAELHCPPVLFRHGTEPYYSENGNLLLDCQIGPLHDPYRLESEIRAIPGVVATGLFLGMAQTILVGEKDTFRTIEERNRQ